MNTDKITAQLIAEILRIKGIKTVVFSPGSRSAPLVIACNANTALDCRVIPDERAAAYFALGIAQQSQTPVAIVCTSGTAVLNFSPAICEAFYQQIPLIAITADRPLSMQNKGENQTINQVEIYKNYTKGFLQMPLEIKTLPEYKQTIHAIAALINTATTAPFGPVHINIPFAEPLYNFTTKLLPPFQVEKTTKITHKLSLNECAKIADATKHKNIMLIGGLLQPDFDLQKNIETIHHHDNIIVVQEVTTNLFLPNGIYRADAITASINKTEIANFAPDIVITFGKQIVSKRIRTFIKQTAATHWHIAEDGAVWSIFDKETTVFQVSENEFMRQMVSCQFMLSPYKKRWLERQKTVLQHELAYFNTVPFSDLSVYQKLFRLFPENCNIHWGNSSAIRYANLLQLPSNNKNFANRGTSGIDGSLSTAVGAAVHFSGFTFCIIGDVSFLYDSNALWNNYLSPMLRIVVINNKGGNIFRWIPGPKTTQSFETFFETKHELDVELLAQMYGLGYYYADSEDLLEAVWPQFMDTKKNKAILLEINTDAQLSEDAIKNYFTALEKI